MSMTAPVHFVVDPQLQSIADKINTGVDKSDREELVREVGIAAAVKNMVYTDIAPEYVAADEVSIREGVDQPMSPGDVRHEICLELNDTILDLGKRYQLSKVEIRRAWEEAIRMVDRIVRASFPQDKTISMEDVGAEMERIEFVDEA